MAAPSAMNRKPWEFVVVTDPEKLAQFRKRLLFGNRNAPAAILVCGNRRTVTSNQAAAVLGAGLLRRQLRTSSWQPSGWDSPPSGWAVHPVPALRARRAQRSPGCQTTSPRWG